jgi:hypothetical protein
MRVNPRPRVREITVGTPSPEWIEHNARIRPSRSLRVTFYPGRRSTTWTVIQEDWQGHRRWERTIATADMSCTITDLAGEELAEVLRILLRNALENLS